MPRDDFHGRSKRRSNPAMSEQWRRRRSSPEEGELHEEPRGDRDSERRRKRSRSRSRTQERTRDRARSRTRRTSRQSRHRNSRSRSDKRSRSWNTRRSSRIGRSEVSKSVSQLGEAIIQGLDTLASKLGVRENNGAVYLVGHMPPGSDERQKGAHHPAHIAYSDHHNRRFLKLVRKYSDIIVGQFFGHLHSDTFRVIYNDNGRPVSWALLAPALTPKRTTDGANNPGLRIYEFDKDTGQVFDYIQYYLDLSSANSKGEAKWVKEYSFCSHYGIPNITPISLHNLAEKLTNDIHNENSIFARYFTANSVRLHNLHTAAACDAHCAHTHYCAITRIDYQEFEHCLKTAPSALSSSSMSPFVSAYSLYIVITIFLVIYKV